MAKTIQFLKMPGDDVKTPQVHAILKALQSNFGDRPAALKDAYAAIEAHPDFKSRQGAERVLKFYIKGMTEKGLIKVEGHDERETVKKETDVSADKGVQGSAGAGTGASRKKKDEAPGTAAA